jgi:hypothetical protein
VDRDSTPVAREQTQADADWAWRFWFTLPLYPYGQRHTLRKEIIQDTIWTFDQIQGVLYVTVPIRMTMVRLARGGLLIYAPVAPTRECIRLVQELVAQHGEVRYIILPTVSGLEHKVFVGPFARCFPSAQVFVAPHQWSFPVNLPLSWLGFPSQRTHVLPADSRQAPFADEFDYALLGPISLGLGPFAEVAFFHRASQTLLVTDAVVSVPEEPPPIVQLDPAGLLFHAKDHALEQVADTQANRLKGWQRICLFSFYFRPSALDVVPLGKVVSNALKSPYRSRQNYFGLYPFRWQPGWERSFAALRGDGRLFVAPILQTLILNRAPAETLAWANRVASWPLQRIIPCHFDAPIAADARQFRRAFAFLEQHPADADGVLHAPLPEADFEFLKTLEAGLIKRGITPAAKAKV